ncbi:GFA family protein [Aestuariivirga sp.]|uniref:GFA family protein n=1 Tax=Aestuariivirga sp. TaxID=2650926 RepID=UPI003BAAEF2C
MSKTEAVTGGCQCGAVRYRIEGALGPSGFCHCRMCQKAFGSFGAPLVSVPHDQFHWTRGTPAVFHSSPIVQRGFCRDCGTPLFMLEEGHGVIEMAIGSLDDPSIAAPDHVVGIESKLAWADTLPTLPSHSTDDDRTPEDLAKLKSLQHPDHDTADWPPLR